MRFVDEATINVIAGDGGTGVVSFRREKFSMADLTVVTAGMAAAYTWSVIMTSILWPTFAMFAPTPLNQAYVAPAQK